MTDHGTITHLWTSPRKGQHMEGHEEIPAIADHGLENCAHAGKSKDRQVLLIEEEVLANFDLQPGQIKENITTKGIGLESLPTGAILETGQGVRIEVVGPCEPCGQMDRIRPGLKIALEGQRGVLAMVQNGGPLRLGDSIRLMKSEDQ